MLKSEDGATAVEYGLLIAVMALVVAAAAGTLAGGIKTVFERVAGLLT